MLVDPGLPRRMIAVRDDLGAAVIHDTFAEDGVRAYRKVTQGEEWGTDLIGGQRRRKQPPR
jgi:hypothetical protein